MKPIASKIEIKRVAVSFEKTTREEINVVFPIYLKNGDILDDGYWWDIYRRIDANGYMYELHVNSRDEWEYKFSSVTLSSYLGYVLVKAQYEYDKIPPFRFYEKLAEFQKALANIPTQDQQLSTLL